MMSQPTLLEGAVSRAQPQNNLRQETPTVRIARIMSLNGSQTSPWSAPEADDKTIPHAQQPLQFTDVFFGVLILAVFPVPGAPASLNVGQVATFLLILAASNRRPARSIPWLPIVLLALVTYLCLLSAFTIDTSAFGWEKRAIRLVGVLILLIFIVSGRIHARSLLVGIALGLIGNAVLFYARIAPANYGPVALTGYYLDKNQAGLMYAAMGILILALTRTIGQRVAVILAFGALTYLTGSRTAMAGFAGGVLWFALRPYLSVFGRIVIGVFVYLSVEFIERNFAQVGEFSTRAGSDWFRGQIDAQSQIKLESTPWSGTGLGDAWVWVSGERFLFHNSYWSLLVEGGWIYLVTVLVLYLGFGLGIFRQGRAASLFDRAAEASLIPVLICATRLGEVFGATAATIALAFSLIAYLDYTEQKISGILPVKSLRRSKVEA